VEDEPVIREMVAKMLRIQGYQVLEANDGFEAVRLAQELDGPLNLLLTDVIMPRINGKDLADKLKESRPNLKVLFMSGYSDEMIARHGVLEPGVALIEKPFDSHSLAHKVRQVLGTTGFNDSDLEG
jgi:DNA-binding response OmpR family regulator